LLVAGDHACQQFLLNIVDLLLLKSRVLLDQELSVQQCYLILHVLLHLQKLLIYLVVKNLREQLHFNVLLVLVNSLLEHYSLFLRDLSEAVLGLEECSKVLAHGLSRLKPVQVTLLLRDAYFGNQVLHLSYRQLFAATAHWRFRAAERRLWLAFRGWRQGLLEEALAREWGQLLPSWFGFGFSLCACSLASYALLLSLIAFRHALLPGLKQVNNLVESFNLGISLQFVLGVVLGLCEGDEIVADEVAQGVEHLQVVVLFAPDKDLAHPLQRLLKADI
jgi:hypothetical protein